MRKMPILSKVLLVVAVALFLLPTIRSSYYMNKGYKEMLQRESKIENNKELQASEILVSGDMVLEIPSIELKLPIKHGATHENMLVGVGTMTNIDVAEGRNLTLAGHRFIRRGRGFNRLGDIEKGDIITVKGDGGDVKFEVSEILVVEPDEVSVLDNTGKTEVTLVTCTPMAVSTHRLIIKGEMI